jgi:hypothetical protein
VRGLLEAKGKEQLKIEEKAWLKQRDAIKDPQKKLRFVYERAEALRLREQELESTQKRARPEMADGGCEIERKAAQNSGVASARFAIARPPPLSVSNDSKTLIWSTM